MPTLSSTSLTVPLLAEFGPEAPPRPAPTAEESLAYCRRLARQRQENFPVLARLLVPALVDPFAAVYGFCRWADDLADEPIATDGPGAAQSGHDPAVALAHLAWWREQTIAWHRGDAPSHPVFVALGAVGAGLASPLPLRPFLDLIDAFEQDQRTTRYESWEQLVSYSSRSADPVGRLVLAIGGVRGVDRDPGPDMAPAERDVLEQSDALCTALQLTNFWQDVRRDLFDRDRVYLPSDETGLDARTLTAMAERPRDPASRVRYIRALRPLVERTMSLFDRSRRLHALVPPSLREPIGLFHAAGRATLARIDATGCTTLWSRPALSRMHKSLLVAGTLIRSRLFGREKP